MSPKSPERETYAGGGEAGLPQADARSGEDAHVFTIGALADEFGITTRTIRFYESRGLLSPERLGANRSYSRRDRARLSLILRGKNLGFSLEDIGEYLALYDADPTQVAQTELLLAKVDRAVDDLTGKKVDLERSLRELKDIRAKCIDHLKRARAGANAKD